jgi:hypothetical protein
MVVIARYDSRYLKKQHHSLRSGYAVWRMPSCDSACTTCRVAAAVRRCFWNRAYMKKNLQIAAILSITFLNLAACAAPRDLAATGQSAPTLVPVTSTGVVLIDVTPLAIASATPVLTISAAVLPDGPPISPTAAPAIPSVVPADTINVASCIVGTWEVSGPQVATLVLGTLGGPVAKADASIKSSTGAITYTFGADGVVATVADYSAQLAINAGGRTLDADLRIAGQARGRYEATDTMLDIKDLTGITITPKLSVPIPLPGMENLQLSATWRSAYTCADTVLTLESWNGSARADFRRVAR